MNKDEIRTRFEELLKSLGYEVSNFLNNLSANILGVKGYAMRLQTGGSLYNGGCPILNPDGSISFIRCNDMCNMFELDKEELEEVFNYIEEYGIHIMKTSKKLKKEHLMKKIKEL